MLEGHENQSTYESISDPCGLYDNHFDKISDPLGAYDTYGRDDPYGNGGVADDGFGGGDSGGGGGCSGCLWAFFGLIIAGILLSGLFKLIALVI